MGTLPLESNIAGMQPRLINGRRVCTKVASCLRMAIPIQRPAPPG
jgi:hypothetical protein